MPFIKNIYEEPQKNLKAREADRQENTAQEEMFQNTNTTKVHITVYFLSPFPFLIFCFSHSNHTQCI